MQNENPPAPVGGRRRRWPRRRLLLGAGAVLVAGWLVFVAVSIVLALGDLNRGKKILQRVHKENTVEAVLRGENATDLRVAQRALARAHDRLRNPLLLPTRLIPVAGRQVRSVDALAGAGSRLAGTGADGLADVRHILDHPVTSPTDRISVVEQVGKLAGTTGARVEHIDLGPRRGLIGPVARAYNDLADELDDVRQGLSRASAASTALAGFLTGPRRYLVFAANNAEMRAGSGMFLSVGLLETSNGRLELKDFQTVFDVAVPTGAVPLTGDMADRWGWLNPNRDWRNLMLSPQFGTSAALAAQMWSAAGNGPVDGVVALDPVTLQQMLEVVGPVTVDGRQIDADHVVDELINAQYRRFPTLEERPERREALGRIAQATFALVDAGAWSLPSLGNAVAASVRGRHIMVWSARPDEQAGWQAAAVDGALRPQSLLVSVINRGGNKLDRYLDVKADVDCQRAGDDRECELHLDLHNVTPVDEPPYIAGPHPGSGVSAGDYLGIVAVDLPGEALDSRIDGVTDLAVAGADGPSRVVGFQLVVARGATRQLTVHFRLPGDLDEIRVEPSARVPGIAWSSGRTSWPDGAAHTLHF